MSIWHHILNPLSVDFFGNKKSKPENGVLKKPHPRILSLLKQAELQILEQNDYFPTKMKDGWYLKDSDAKKFKIRPNLTHSSLNSFEENIYIDVLKEEKILVMNIRPYIILIYYLYSSHKIIVSFWHLRIIDFNWPVIARSE